MRSWSHTRQPTRPRSDGELRGLVYSLTDRPRTEDVPWYQRPVLLAVIVLALTLVLNILFF